MPRPLIFISHSSHDKEAARRLASELRQRGAEVWIDHERIKYGESIPKAIESGLAQSACIVVLISPAFLESKWCRVEYEPLLVKEIEQGDIFVVPILIEDCEPPVLLSSKLYVDLQHEEGRDKRLDELAEQIFDRFTEGGKCIPENSSERLPDEQAPARTREERILRSLQARLDEDFFVSGHRAGEFGRTRDPNETHHYQGPVREPLSHKPYYYLTYWGWRATHTLLPNHVEAKARITIDSIKRRFAGRRWIEVEIEDYRSGPTLSRKRVVTVRHTAKAAETLMLLRENTIPSQVAWDLVAEAPNLSNGDGGWKEFNTEGANSSLWASINVFHFLSAIRFRMCDPVVPGEEERFTELTNPIIQDLEEYLEDHWENKKWVFDNLPSQVNAPLILIDYAPFAQKRKLVLQVYESLQDFISPAGRLKKPDVGKDHGAPEYKLSIRIAYALSHTDSIGREPDDRVKKLAEWVLDNYSAEYTLETCDMAFLEGLVRWMGARRPSAIVYPES
jgi:hypothetical protein